MTTLAKCQKAKGHIYIYKKEYTAPPQSKREHGLPGTVVSGPDLQRFRPLVAFTKVSKQVRPLTPLGSSVNLPLHLYAALASFVTEVLSDPHLFGG